MIKERAFDKNFVLILCFAVYVKIFLMFQLFETGGDAINYWVAAKQILSGINPSPWTHFNARFGIIIPLVFFQGIFGQHPLVASLLAMLFSFIQIFALYYLLKKMAGTSVACSATLLFIIFPDSIRAGTQILPAVFSGAYVILSILFFYKYLDNERKSLPFLLLSALMLFLSYISTVTNIFFMPGFVLLICLKEKRSRNIVIFCSFLLLLFICETLFYYFYSGIKTGIIGITMSTHLQGSNAEKLLPLTFLQLFGRYLKLGLTWKILLLLFSFSSIVIFKSTEDIKKRGLVIITLSFFLFITFSIKSINPIVPAVLFHERYFVAALPMIFAVISIAFNHLSMDILKISAIKVNEGINKKLLIIVLVVTSLSFIIPSFIQLPLKFSRYYNNLLEPWNHKIIVTDNYYKMINEAYENNLLIISGYNYTTMDYNTYLLVQKLEKEGLNLQEAITGSGCGLTLKQYLDIRPNLPVKGLNLIRKVFLKIPSDKIPDINKITIDKNIYFYIQKNQIYTDEILKNKILNGDTVYIYTAPFKGQEFIISHGKDRL
ncbi:MAG TPA: glycosyltransferase family 39 protein [Spirochaetota bacterium]|nr:glycosyltransferase family 39 protein [Spirochaetota bacterium]